MKTRQATKRNQQVAVHETISNLNKRVRSKKRRLSENSSNDIDVETTTNDNFANTVKEELSSDSSSDEFLKVNELDLDSEFFKPLKKNEFEEIENNIFSDVSRLSDSESADTDNEFEVPEKQNNMSSQKFPVKKELSSSLVKEKRRRGLKETVTKPKKKLKCGNTNKKELESSGNSTEQNTVDVLQLLALGEGSSVTDARDTKALRRKGLRKRESESDDSDDWENVETSEQKPVEHNIPKEGVAVTLKLPSLYEKRKKKGFDWEAHMLRRLNKVKREIQVLLHKVHLLCLIAHCRYVNSVLNSSDLMAVALSLIPSDRCYPPEHSNLKYLEHFVTWFTSAVVVNINASKDSSSDLPLEKALEVQLEKKTANSKRELVMMFVCTSRAVGLKVRLVVSLQPLPLKPPSSELCSISDTGKHKNNKKNSKGSNGADYEKPPKSSHKSKIKGKTASGGEVEEKRSRVSEMESKKCKALKILHEKGKSVPKEAAKKGGEKVSKNQENLNEKRSSVSVKKSGKDEKASGAGSVSGGRGLRARKSNVSVKYCDNSSEDSGSEEESKKDSPERGKTRQSTSGEVKSESDLAAGSGSKRSSPSSSKKKHVHGKQSTDSEFEEKPLGGATQRDGVIKRRASKVAASHRTEDSESDGEFEPSQPSSRRRSSQGSEVAGKKKDRCDVWAEVFLEEEEKWICVDVHRGRIHCITHIYVRVSSWLDGMRCGEDLGRCTKKEHFQPMRLTL